MSDTKEEFDAKEAFLVNNGFKRRRENEFAVRVAWVKGDLVITNNMVHTVTLEALAEFIKARGES